MRQLVYQIIALILDQRIRLSQKYVVLHHRTIDIQRPTRGKDRLKSQRRKVWTEEHENRVLCPETRHPSPSTTIERVVSDVVLLLHIRLRTDKGGFLIPSCSLNDGKVQDVGHEVLEKGSKDIGFEHGGIAMSARGAARDVEYRTDHRCLGKSDGVFDGWLAVAAIFDCVGVGDGQDESEEVVDLEKFHCWFWSNI